MRVLLLGLALAAGYVDALSYLGLGVFTANMTGNTVLLGLALAERSGEGVVRSLLALGGFLGGAVAAAWIVQRDDPGERWPRAVSGALFVEAVILAALGIGWVTTGAASDTAARVLIVFSAVAMGMQSAAVNRLDVYGVTTTYITGTLTHLGAGLTDRARRRRGRKGEHPSLLAAVWVVYLGGAAFGAFALDAQRTVALVLPVALVAAIAAAGIIIRP